MTVNTTLLRNPATLLLGLPVRTAKSKCFTKDNVHLVSETDSNLSMLYMDMNDPGVVAVLQRVLQKTLPHADWLNYFRLEDLYFHWVMNNQEYGSSNPHFELFMRCLTLLLNAVNGTVSGKCIPAQEEVENIVEAMNTSLMGLGLIELKIPASGPLHVPALFHPPFIRECHSHILTSEDISVLPDVSVHLLQCILHTLVTEIWISEIQTLVSSHLNESKSMRYSEVKEYYECLCKITKDVLLCKQNPLLEDIQYSKYINARLNPSNKTSDVNRLYAIANALTIQTNEINPKFLEYISQLSPGFASHLSCKLQKKMDITLSTGETENGRIKPKVFELYGHHHSQENWAMALQGVADSNAKRFRDRSDNHIQFDVRPVVVESAASNLEITHMGDTQCLLKEKKKIKTIKNFCICM